MCLKTRNALWIILIVSVAGLLFSGFLSFSELFSGSCPLGGCRNLLGMPTCVYGFVMYLAIFVISILGLGATEKNKKPEKSEYNDKVKMFLKYTRV